MNGLQCSYEVIGPFSGVLSPSTTWISEIGFSAKHFYLLSHLTCPKGVWDIAPPGTLWIGKAAFVPQQQNQVVTRGRLTPEIDSTCMRMACCGKSGSTLFP